MGAGDQFVGKLCTLSSQSHLSPVSRSSLTHSSYFLLNCPIAASLESIFDPRFSAEEWEYSL